MENLWGEEACRAGEARSKKQEARARRSKTPSALLALVSMYGERAVRKSGGRWWIRGR